VAFGDGGEGVLGVAEAGDDVGDLALVGGVEGAEVDGCLGHGWSRLWPNVRLLSRFTWKVFERATINPTQVLATPELPKNPEEPLPLMDQVRYAGFQRQHPTISELIASVVCELQTQDTESRRLRFDDSFPRGLQWVNGSRRNNYSDREE
jgi:hypothetical protein